MYLLKLTFGADGEVRPVNIFNRILRFEALTANSSWGNAILFLDGGSTVTVRETVGQIEALLASVDVTILGVDATVDANANTGA